MLGLVVQHLDAVGADRLGHHLPGGDDVLGVVGGAPGVAGVVDVGVVRLKALGSVGVHNQHLRAVAVNLDRIFRFQILLRLLVEEGGAVLDDPCPKGEVAGGVADRHVLFDDGALVLLRDAVIVGWLLVFRDLGGVHSGALRCL